MASNALITFLVVANILVAFTSLWEFNFPRALYWTGASLINIAILWGTDAG